MQKIPELRFCFNRDKAGTKGGWVCMRSCTVSIPDSKINRCVSLRVKLDLWASFDVWISAFCQWRHWW